MRILLDENIAFSIQKALLELGHDVDHVKKLGIGGVPNGQVYERAQQGYHLFIINDRHFLNPDIFPPHQGLGVIFLRISMVDPNEQINALKEFLTNELEDHYIGHLTILRSDGYDIR